MIVLYYLFTALYIYIYIFFSFSFFFFVENILTVALWSNNIFLTDFSAQNFSDGCV